jgi:hypothetical protein
MICLQQAQNVQPLHSDSIHLRIELAKPSTSRRSLCASRSDFAALP